MSYPDATYLRALKRSELQRLAREHSVKANLKSKVIIDVLLQQFSDAKATQSRLPDAQHTSAAEVDARPQIDVLISPNLMATGPHAVSDLNRKSLENMDSLDTGRRSRIAAASIDHARSERIAEATNTMDNPCHDITYPDSPPDNSKREDLPAEQCLVEETVDVLAKIDRDNEKIIKRIMKLRAATAELRSRTKAVRDVVRAEDFNRVRLLTYLTYWQPVDDRWSYHEVWSGKIKIRHPDDLAGVTSSDEEDDNENIDSDQDIVSLRLNSALSDGSATGELDSVRPPVRVDPEINGITTAESLNVIPRPGQKRSRNDTADEDLLADDLRYTPRRRTDNNDPDKDIIKIEAHSFEILEHFSPPSTPTPRRVSKGKKKMTTEQVQALENELAAERFLDEILASNPYLQPSAVRMDAKEGVSATEERIPSFEPVHASTQSELNVEPRGHP